MELVLNADAGTARLGDVAVKDKWALFLGVLVRARLEDPNQWVGPDAFAQLGPWRYQKVENIGRQVSAFLDRLQKGSSEPAIEFPPRGKTLCWRLAPAVETLRVLPDEAGLASWLAAMHGERMREDASVDRLTTDDDKVVQHMSALVDALILIASGASGDALERLDAVAAGGKEERRLVDPRHATFHAWETLLRARATNRMDDELTLDMFTRGRTSHGVHALRSVQARLWSLRALHEMFLAPEESMARLARLIVQLEESGDIGALAVALNSMGLLQKTANRSDLAEETHLRALALAGISGDFIILDAILYNIAACRAQRLADQGLPPDQGVLHLIELCLRFEEHFNIGRDRIISEVDAALWSVRSGDVDRAASYLDSVAGRVDQIPSEMDKSYFALACAEVEIARWERDQDPSRLVRAAGRLDEATRRNRLLNDPNLAREIAQARQRVPDWKRSV